MSPVGAFYKSWRGPLQALSTRDRLGLSVLAAACVALAALVYAEINDNRLTMVRDVSSRTANEQAQTLGQAREPAFSIMPFETYRAVIERPLFSSTRRAAAKEAPEDRIESSAFVLTGVILSGAGRSALIQQGNPPKIMHINEGQDIGGWTVESIRADRVVIRSGAVEEELKLRKDTKIPG